MKSRINGTLKFTFLVLMMLLFVALGQAGQFLTSSREWRDSTLLHWQRTHPEQSQLAAQCVNTCRDPPENRRG
ncbi:hypothetical protein V4D09_02765 [Vibrio mimicus]|uniref:hypothetical protein n=1 Tax=Vibrio mimicus TaxID=674 RepID=UPI002F933A41